LSHRIDTLGFVTSDVSPSNRDSSEADQTAAEVIDALPTRVGLTRDAPVATIMTTIVLVLITLGSLQLLSRVTNVLTLLLMAAFFAVVLTPPVNFLVRRAHVPRGIAATIVFLTGIVALVAMAYTFITPLAKQGNDFVDKLPTYVKDAEAGEGPVGKLVERYKLDTWLEENQAELQKRAETIFEPKTIFGVALGTVGTVFSSVAAIVTIMVLTFFMLLEGHELLHSGLRIFDDRRRTRLLNLGHQSARAINGYMAGNLLISVIAGATTFVALLILQVPFAGVLALWVAFADLIPVVGATIGSVPPIIMAFLVNTPTGIAAFVFYAVYQQFENHVLQTTIMSRTVSLKPLVVVASVLLGIELYGLLGALLAIPAAGVIKVIGADIVAHRRPDLVPGVDARQARRLERLRRKSS
jgi:predicted PurR-regulated permease PerM